MFFIVITGNKDGSGTNNVRHLEGDDQAEIATVVRRYLPAHREIKSIKRCSEASFIKATRNI